MSRIRLLSILVVGLLSSLLNAQTPAGSSPAPQTAPRPASPAQRVDERLPVRRVVLYKSGVGYFEHLGQVRGNQAVGIDFTSGQLNDVLKSLTTLDLDGGRVTGVSYNSDAGLERRLSALRLPIGGETTRAQFLNALRGARLDVGSGAARVVGRLLSVEATDRRRDNVVTRVETISIVTDSGEMQTIALDPGVVVRIAESDLNQEVGRYLSLIASVRDQDVRRLTISTAGAGVRDLFVSYVSEVPVWKATYRLVLPAAGESRRPLLQGWAIVDNTVGQDWNGVELSLVAGAPQSFVQAISQPLYVQRPVVPLPERMLMSPQTHQSGLATSGTGMIAGTVTDIGGGVLPGVTVRVTRGGAPVADGVTDASGRFRVSGLTPGAYDATFSLAGFRQASRRGVNVSGGMESVMNVAMEVGGTTESVTVGGAVGGVAGAPPPPAAPPPPRPLGFGAGAAGGRGGGRGGIAMDAIDTMRVAAARQAQQAEAAGAELGDLFEYKLREPVTIRMNQSALVPILGGEVAAEKVSLWNAGTGSNRPLRAIWLTNSTNLTLDGGSFSIVEGQAFAGEGLMDPLKAGEKRLLSYAMDLGMNVDATGEAVPSRVTRVQASRGVIVQQIEERQKQTFTARNDDAEARTLVVEHPVRTGWTLGGDVKPAETTASWHRFKITVAPRTTATFTAEETRPVTSQITINAITDNQIALFVRDKSLTPALEAALREVIRRKNEIARLTTEINTRQSEIDSLARDQERVRGNMQALKGSSAERALLQRYVTQLGEQETRIETLRTELRGLTAQRDKAQADLGEFVMTISG